jgi:iron(III) transport system substrate-binding protein
MNTKFNTGKGKFTLTSISATMLLAMSVYAQAATELTVYTALEADQLQLYKATFNEEYPDIKINWVRDSTGIVTAKLLAEKENSRADVVWGLAGTSLMLLANEGMLEPYAPKGVEKLAANFKDSATPPRWTGMNAWASAICYNTIEAKKLGLPKPTSWEDLLDPVYKGYISMPNPSSSGTGFLDVSGWLQIFGDDKGWEYMSALHKNIERYTHSGSKPCRLAASGETPIGISYAYRASKLKNQGAPLDIIVPSEGIGWDLEVGGIIKGTKNLEAAQKLMDFSVSVKANEMYNKSFAVLAIKGIAKPVKNFPKEISARMIDNDFEWAAANRSEILSKWNTLFHSKSEAK